MNDETRPTTTRRFDPGLLALGIAEVGLLSAMGWNEQLHTFPWAGLGTFGAAFLVYLAAATRLYRGDSRAGSRATIWGFAIAMRLALLPLVPELSDDLYRYLWDGHVQLSGTNPYLFPPAASDLAEIRTSYHGLINNPTVPTIYPPFAQLAFFVIALAGSSVVFLKLVWLTCDLLTGLVLERIAALTGRSVGLVSLLYLWSPLLVIEVAWSGHLEPLGLLALVGAVWAAHHASLTAADVAKSTSGLARAGESIARLTAGAALAVSALTKFAPAAALPALMRRHGWQPAVAFGITCAVLYAPYVEAGPRLFTGLATYGEHWWFMKGPFSVLEWATGDPDRARRAAGLIVLAVVGWTVAARYDLERALFWTLGAGMIVTPTLHPWYTLWMLPLAALRSSRPWIVLSGLAFVGYFGLGSYQETGEWLQPLLARAMLWTPFLALLAFEARSTLRAGLIEPLT